MSMPTVVLPVARPAISISPADLPALPTVMTEILRLANDPETSVQDMERIIGNDQSLALRVLKVANSSFYGCSREVGAIGQAVTLLGTRQIQNIASALALAPMFQIEDTELVDGSQLWAHGLATALWTDVLAREGHLPHGAHLFTAALLHDIGIVLLLRSAPDLMLQALESARAGGQPLCEVETELFGTDHAALGATACSAWKLPESLVRLIEGHENPTMVTSPDARLLAMAEQVASHTGSAAFEWRPAPEPGLGDWEALGIEAARAPVVLENRHAIAVSVSSLFGG